MADTKIEDLPTLDPQDFNPLTDFMIIQKPSGGTFKMLAGAAGAGGGSGTLTSYIDSASSGGPYTGGFHFGNSYSQSYGSIEFQKDGLLNSSSAFVLNFNLKNMNHGQYINNTRRLVNGTVLHGSKPFAEKSFRFIKPSNIDLVNSIYSTNSTQQFVFFDQGYSVARRSSPKGGHTGWYENTSKLICDLVFDQANDTIIFSDITLHHTVRYGRSASHYGWPRHVDMEADINGNIGV